MAIKANSIKLEVQKLLRAMDKYEVRPRGERINENLDDFKLPYQACLSQPHCLHVSVRCHHNQKVKPVLTMTVALHNELPHPRTFRSTCDRQPQQSRKVVEAYSLPFQLRTIKSPQRSGRAE